MKSDAYLSPDRKFRYWLVRIWDDSLPIMANWGSNPSRADEKENDPTIRKDIGFAERTGHGGLLKFNVGAYRATNPKVWYGAADPFGPENTIPNFRRWLREFNPIQLNTPTCLAAWGRCVGRFAYRGRLLAENFPMMCLGTTADGTPRHTLMLPYSTPLQPWAPNYNEKGE